MGKKRKLMLLGKSNYQMTYVDNVCSLESEDKKKCSYGKIIGFRIFFDKMYTELSLR